MKKTAAIFAVTALLLCGCTTQSASTVQQGITAEKLSNDCIGWGFKKTDGGPQFTQEQEEIMHKYDCIYHSNTKDKVLYLTFDEGYEKGYTPEILDTLREKNVKAAFFVTGAYAKGEPDLLKRMAQEGHIIGNHSDSHPSMPSLSDEDAAKELLELDRLVFAQCRKTTHYFRPPKGEYSERTLKIAQGLGYVNTFWSFAYVDWNDDVTKDAAFENIKKAFHNGTVILLHAVSKGNAQALGDVIDEARRRGFEFKTLDEYK